MAFHIIHADILLIARIFPRPFGARKNTTQLAKYPCILYVKPSNKIYVSESASILKRTILPSKRGLTTNLQFGMLIPAGIPLLPNPSTSSEVKSGRKNLSFSYSGGQGRAGSSSSALDTSNVNFALISLFTTETNPAVRKR